MEKEIEQAKVKSIINDTFSQLKTISSSKTIMGEPMISKFGSVIIPVSKATIGFVLGAGEYEMNERRRSAITYPIAGGSGGGVNLTPVGFLVENESGMKFIPVENGAVDNIQKIMDIASNAVDVFGGKE